RRQLDPGGRKPLRRWRGRRSAAAPDNRRNRDQSCSAAGPIHTHVHFDSLMTGPVPRVTSNTEPTEPTESSYLCVLCELRPPEADSRWRCRREERMSTIRQRKGEGQVA